MCGAIQDDKKRRDNGLYYIVNTDPDVKFKIVKIDVDIVLIQQLSRDRLEAIGQYSKGFVVEEVKVAGLKTIKIKAFSRSMDLDFNNLQELSEYFINRFVVDTKDPGLHEVLNFYKCYRASVRGKIGLLTAHEPEVDDATRADFMDQATQYFLLAQRYAETR